MKKQEELQRIADSMELMARIAQKNQRQNEKINQERRELIKEYKNVMDLTAEYCSNIQELKERVDALEKMLSKVPEFYDYWKQINGCGYAD